jgi:hypothetical protein
MSHFETRWTELHQQLSDDYKAADGNLADCNQIAIELEGLLCEQNVLTVPYIVFGTPAGPNTFSEITPVPYEGRIRWTCHVICVAEEFVFDPMLERPTDKGLYPELAFIEPVHLHPLTG